MNVLMKWRRGRTAGAASAADGTARAASYELTTAEWLWALGSFCAINRKAFDAQLLLQQFPPPHSSDALIKGARALGFRIERREWSAAALQDLSTPCLAMIQVGDGPKGAAAKKDVRIALIVQADASRVVYFPGGTNDRKSASAEEFAQIFLRMVFLLFPEPAALTDPDGKRAAARSFGFRWFIPELLRHRRVWREVLAASLVIQVLALGTPLFTQVLIDKVVVHRSQSTLVVISVGMVVFMVFTAILSWVRQYLVLHTGNRVDAVLGAAVFEYLLRLPPRYFEQRPTGVITARLRGIETIREFIASAAVTVCLDLPFLIIFVAIMLEYSVPLTAIALGMIAVVIVASLIVAPIFRTRLNEQFLLGARNQAFATEYVSGMETVKSLQLEPQLRNRYGILLAEYLRSGFGVRQIANTYNVFANSMEQLMTLAILTVGAYLVMTGANFTIGMLVAFQMFASRVSQPLLRMVGLWQQFQQASLSVERLGDIMNAPTEPYALEPRSARDQKGLIEIVDVSFKYGDSLPFLFQGLNLRIDPGRLVAVMGASGSGKSTLAKLLQGFYMPAGGAIRLDGQDLRHLAANELRLYFGVVPQETTLFAGTVYDNLLMANPMASFDDIVHVCRIAEIHGVIEKLPQGYQTLIGERGVGLSTGQKQRIAVARALLKRPRILIFDEATSSLDHQTAEHLSATINSLKGEVTMIFITHVLPKSLQVDEIVKFGSKATLPDIRLSSQSPREPAVTGP